jgi:uncharacterized membrane protein
MKRSLRLPLDNLRKHLGWWILFVVCVFYSAYALFMGILAFLSLLGIADNAPQRGAPLLFVVHALAGSLALLAGPLQLNRRILYKHRNFHRLLGRMYVWAIWISSVGGFWSAVFFDVHITAKMAFGVLAVLWFAITTAAYLRVRRRTVTEHREWMIRSFALSFFFVTGGFSMPAMANTSLPTAVSEPLGVLLGWLPNLIAAEVWIRWTRGGASTRELASLTNATTPPERFLQATRGR